jgi:hypothetical protein
MGFSAKYRTRYTLLAIVAAFFVPVLLVSPAQAFSGQGAGTVGDPFQIYTCDQFQEISSDLSAYYRLEDDVDCTGETYTPIGTSGSPFTGVLSGELNTISNVTITGVNDLGLFGYINGGVVQDVRLSDISVSGGSSLGTVGGNVTDGVIANIRADDSSSVTGTGGNVGGLIGSAAGSTSISKSHYSGSVVLSGSYGGGLLGYATGAINISNSYANGTINGGSSYIGGLVGSINSGAPAISNSYAAATITGTASYTGGFMGGLFVGTVEDSFSASDMNAVTGLNPGAMFGVGDGTSTNNYFDQYLADRSNCSGTGTAACTGVNAANAEPDYFTTNANAPLDTWNFDYTWTASSGNLPAFATFGALQVDTPDVSETTINFGYTFLGLSGSGPITSPQLRYRVAGTGSLWTYATVTSTADENYTISGLSPGTTYEIELRALFNGAGEYSDWADGSFTAATLAATASSAGDDSTTALLAPTGQESFVYMLVGFAAITMGVLGFVKLSE